MMDDIVSVPVHPPFTNPADTGDERRRNGGRPDGSGLPDATAGGRAAAVVSVLTLAVGLGGLALGVEWAWIAFPLGYGGVLPLAVSYARRSDAERSDARRRDRDAADDGPLATLRDRYARGDIDDEEFERRVEGLLETE